MAWKDKEKAKEYQRKYYWNKTKLKRLTEPAKSYNNYVKKDPEEKLKNFREGARKRKQTLIDKLGEEGYKEHQVNLGKLGHQALVDSGKPIGFQAGYAKEAGRLGLKSRGLKSKHKKTREKWQNEA